jgi:putative oxidoreductase
MLPKLLKPRAEAAYAALRIVSGLLFSFHGAQKMFGLFGGTQPEVFTQVWVGGIIELVGGLAIALGLFTVWAAFLASGTMAVAYFQFHWKLQLGKDFFPAINKGELAVVYCFIFFYLACRGPGKFSVDQRLGRS